MTNNAPEELSEAEIEALRCQRFDTMEEALRASEEILVRFGGNPEVMRRLNSTPVNVPFAL